MKYLRVSVSISILLLISVLCSAQKTNGNILQNKKDSLNKGIKTIQQEKLKKEKKDKDDYYKSDYLRYEDYEYKDNIKTVNLFRDGFELSAPMIELSTNDVLKLEFDDLDGDIKNYKYYFIHCEADWKPSIIENYEFETGFSEDFISDYKYSYNTIQKYTHYNLIFPNDNIKLISSGNYIVVVYIEDNKDDIVLTRRFQVLSPILTINATIKPATINEERNYKQEIDISINANSYPILDPYTNLKVVVQQNGRTDNMLTDIKPQVIAGNMISYNENGEIRFNGGNEFRNFDIKSILNNSIRVRNITLDSATGRDYVTLLNDDRRSFKQYLKDEDIDGRFLIKDDDNATDAEREGDYVYVHFTLPYSAPLVDGELYILGALTDWRYSKENKMQYNFKQKAYVCTLYLKQGYYNYEYVFLPNNSSIGDETFIEGNHFETENGYTIYAYNREQGTTYDKLVGIKQLTTQSY